MKITAKERITLCFLATLVFMPILFAACDEGSYLYPYAFKNETQYHIFISVNKNYKISVNKDYNNKDDDTGADDTKDDAISKDVLIELNSHTDISITVHGESALDFQWTTNNAEHNSKIYSTVSGNTVTFRER
jgi:hypothetical protein